MERRAAIRTTGLKDFATHGAELAANRIGRLAVWTEEAPAVYLVGRIRRTTRIRTEAMRLKMRNRHNRTNWNSRRNPTLRELDLELLRQFADYLVIELRSIPLLKHADGRLMAADFGR